MIAASSAAIRTVSSDCLYLPLPLERAVENQITYVKPRAKVKENINENHAGLPWVYSCILHGRYEDFMKIPVIELNLCIVCGICTEMCPSVFSLNEVGYIEVRELAAYPESEIDEVIKNCPANCISWE